MHKKDLHSLFILFGGIAAGWAVCMVVLFQHLTA